MGRRPNVITLAYPSTPSSTPLTLHSGYAQAARVSKERLGKLGVFWHTQGSGKSYSMVFFTRKIHRKLGGNYTFLICTDRDDLDPQIYKTFADW